MKTFRLLLAIWVFVLAQILLVTTTPVSPRQSTTPVAQDAERPNVEGEGNIEPAEGVVRPVPQHPQWEQAGYHFVTFHQKLSKLAGLNPPFRIYVPLSVNPDGVASLNTIFAKLRGVPCFEAPAPKSQLNSWITEQKKRIKTHDGNFAFDTPTPTEVCSKEDLVKAVNYHNAHFAQELTDSDSKRRFLPQGVHLSAQSISDLPKRPVPALPRTSLDMAMLARLNPHSLE